MFNQTYFITIKSDEYTVWLNFTKIKKIEKKNNIDYKLIFVLAENHGGITKCIFFSTGISVNDIFITFLNKIYALCKLKYHLWFGFKSW